jgi:hypothetical protein
VGTINISQPYRPPQAVTGLALLFILFCLAWKVLGLDKMYRSGIVTVWVCIFDMVVYDAPICGLACCVICKPFFT